MSVQVVYKKAFKPWNLGNVVLFVDEKLNFINPSKFINKSDVIYIKKILKHKIGLKENIVLLNIDDKKNAIIVSINKNHNLNDYEILGAKLFNFLENNSIKNIAVDSSTLQFNNRSKFLCHFLHGIKLKSYKFEIYKSKQTKNILKVEVNGDQSTVLKKSLDA